MRLCSTLLAALALISAAPDPCRAAPSLSDTLGFEVPGPDGMIAGWQGGPSETIALDSLIVHGGRLALRFLRDASSQDEYSHVARVLPVTFTGDSIAVRGWLRTDNVRGYAGLWLREDGRRGQLALDTMEDQHLSGTTPWTEFRVSLPLHRGAKSIVFGTLLVGEGALYADDLRLLVDGKEPSRAPRIPPRPTAIATDHEFDAGSRFTATRVKSAQVEKLALLAKVWGFVKYHHPRVTSAELHWDYELFRILPSIMGITRRGEAESLIVRWLDRVGEPKTPNPPAAPPDSAQSWPRIEWIHNRATLGKDLSARLERIYARRDADEEQYYVALEGVGVPDFSNEASYAEKPLPDAGYRLLALFRFWNIVEYWAPYRDLIREDWDGVLRQFIPRVMDARGQGEYRLTMMALVARVGDGHTNLWSSLDIRPPRGDCQLPIVLRFLEGKFVVAAHADSVLGARSGLRVGDVVQKLDGAPLDSLARAYAQYYGASNETARMRDIARFLTRGPRGPCRVDGIRKDGPFELTAQRDSVRLMDGMAGTTHDLPGATFRLLDKDVAYLKLSSLAAGDVSDYVKAAAGTRYLVIDIRGYPKVPVFGLGQHLVAAPTPFVRFTHGDLTNPGAFLWTPPMTLTPAEPHYAGRIVILVDEMSMSAAEYSALALRAVPNSLVAGSTTAGADGNITRIPLPGDMYTWISGIGIFYPDKTPTQRVGIVPDLEVLPTVEGIRKGRDEVLEAALKHVLGREIIIRP